MFFFYFILPYFFLSLHVTFFIWYVYVYASAYVYVYLFYVRFFSSFIFFFIFPFFIFSICYIVFFRFFLFFLIRLIYFYFFTSVNFFFFFRDTATSSSPSFFPTTNLLPAFKTGGKGDWTELMGLAAANHLELRKKSNQKFNFHGNGTYIRQILKFSKSNWNNDL